MAKLFRGNKTFTIGTTSVRVLGENRSRSYLLVQNRGDGAVYLNLGEVASASNGLALASGQSWEPFEVPGDSLHLVAAAGTEDVVIVEV